MHVLDWLMFLQFLLIYRFPHHPLLPLAIYLFKKLDHLSYRVSIVWVLLIASLWYYFPCSSGQYVSWKLVVLEAWSDSGLILCQERIMV